MEIKLHYSFVALTALLHVLTSYVKEYLGKIHQFWTKLMNCLLLKKKTLKRYADLFKDNKSNAYTAKYTHLYIQ